EGSYDAVELRVFQAPDGFRYVLRQRRLGRGSGEPAAGEVDWSLRSDACGEAEYDLRTAVWPREKVAHARCRRAGSWRVEDLGNPGVCQRISSCRTPQCADVDFQRRQPPLHYDLRLGRVLLGAIRSE